ncbi:MAG: hypothetical protein R2695_14120 [Acidimicrobiales bacterium]
MLLAAFDDNGYKTIVFLHVLAMFAAFAPMFVHPFLDRQTRGDGARPRSSRPSRPVRCGSTGRR